MSRIGQQPIKVPDKVKVEVKDQVVKITGPLGELNLPFRSELKVAIKDGQVLVTRQQENRMAKALHGLSRTLIANAITGVTEGWEKTLKLVGTGYRVALEGENLNLTLGFSHPVVVKPEPGVKFKVEGKEIIIVSGVDKALVGRVAAAIRKIRPPEPYKGKGIRYLDEVVKRKPGKAAKVGAEGFEGGKE